MWIFYTKLSAPDSRIHNNLFIDRCKRNVRRVTSNPSSALKTRCPYRMVGPHCKNIRIWYGGWPIVTTKRGRRWKTVENRMVEWKAVRPTNPTPPPMVRGQTFHFFVPWPENKCESFPINIKCCCIWTELTGTPWYSPNGYWPELTRGYSHFSASDINMIVLNAC